MTGPAQPGPGAGSDPPRARRRPLVLGCLLAVIAAALLSRRHPLPGLLAEHAGDALYTVALFLALAVCRPASSARRLGVLALSGSALVEASQLAAWPWLVWLRSTPVGALFLGQGWKAVDLVAYAVGAGLAVSMDGLLWRPAVRRHDFSGPAPAGPGSVR